MAIIDRSTNGEEQVLRGRKTLENDTAVSEELRVQEENSPFFFLLQYDLVYVCVCKAVLSTHCHLPFISNLIFFRFLHVGPLTFITLFSKLTAISIH